MIGKIAAAGVAGAVAYNKLKGMDSEGILGVGSRVTEMVQSAVEKADKSEFLKSVRSTLESSKAGQIVVGAVSKGIGAVQSGASRFFEVMAQAKEQADRGEGTFGKNIVKNGLESAKGGLQGMVASGVTAVADKLGFVSKGTAEEMAASSARMTEQVVLGTLGVSNDEFMSKLLPDNPTRVFDAGAEEAGEEDELPADYDYMDYPG